MEQGDRERIERAVEDNFEVKRLYSKHQEYESRLDVLGRKLYLTSVEVQEQKELKQAKLRGVERMLKLVGERALDDAA
jgi:hypothetical protein